MSGDVIENLFGKAVDPIIYGSATKAFGPHHWAALALAALAQASGKDGFPTSKLSEIRDLLGRHMPVLDIQVPDPSIKAAWWTPWDENWRSRSVTIQLKDGSELESSCRIDTMDEAVKRAKVLFEAYGLIGNVKFRALTLEEESSPWLNVDDASVDQFCMIRIYCAGTDKWYQIADVKVEDVALDDGVAYVMRGSYDAPGSGTWEQRFVARPDGSVTKDGKELAGIWDGNGAQTHQRTDMTTWLVAMGAVPVDGATAPTETTAEAVSHVDEILAILGVCSEVP